MTGRKLTKVLKVLMVLIKLKAKQVRKKCKLVHKCPPFKVLAMFSRLIHNS